MHATLTDFGLCRAINSSTIIGTRTMMTGSPGFQAPEQLRAESLGPHCDIYAFGCHDSNIPGKSTMAWTEPLSNTL